MSDTADTDLLVLANARLANLLNKPDDQPATLDNVMRRLFDRDSRELLTVSAFGSAL